MDTKNSAYNCTPIDPNNEVEPRLNGQIGVHVTQDLKPKSALACSTLCGRIRIKPRYESVQSIKHGCNLGDDSKKDLV
jgi:hypothetical protein